MTEATGWSETLLATAEGDRPLGPRWRDERRFHALVGLTFLIHLLLLVGFNASEPRRLGAPGGADDAISVSIITEADLRGTATVEDRAAGAAVPPPAPPPDALRPPAAEAAPAPPVPAETPTPLLPEPQPPAETPKPETAKAPPPETPVPDGSQKPADAPVIEPTPDLLALPDPSEKPAPKPSEAKASASKGEEAPQPKPDAQKAAKPPAKKADPAPEQKTAKLDLTPPAVFSAPIGGGGAGVQRPAGITRSGENDAFARGVIRALQTTMPQLSNTRGRVTVRITLDMKGNLVSTEVVKPSTVAGLDQSVVFATRQSSFPFPPYNAKPVDLVFIVTYIYR